MKLNPSHTMRALRNFILGATGLVLFASSALAGNDPAPSAPAASSPAPEAPAGKLGVQLWAENCGRCHNIRAQNSLSPSQWEVVMLHMRVRANLPADEAKKILAFLKSGH